MQELKAELAGRMGEAEWDWLLPHAERDALIIVSPELDLLDVGVAIANDEVSPVQSWIQKKLLYKPSPKQMKDWGSKPNKRFNALIVQPYVLAQDV